MPLVLGVDSSTQATKVELRDLDTGVLAAVGRAPHPPTSPPRSEQDPDAWWAALCSAAAEALAQAPGMRVAAVSVAGQQHGLVVLDDRDRVLRPAKLWNDTESAPHARELVTRLGAARWASETGSVPVASFTVTKIAWLAEHEPDLLERVHRVLLPHDWLTFRLAGHFVTDRGDASGTGYFETPTGAWRPDLLELACGGTCPAATWAQRLPRVLGPTEAAGEMAGAAARVLGLDDVPLVAAGTGDNMAAALGLALGPGDVAISLGTSGTVYGVSPEPTADPSGAVAGFADATGRFLPLVCTLNATQVTDTFAGLLGMDRDQLAEAALAEPAGAGGVVLVPYLSGERTPDRPDATGTLSGLRTATRPGQVARAAFEGVTCGLLDGLAALDAAGVPTDGRLMLLGGGARSPAYQRVVTDLAARPVTVATGAEHVATGACVQAAATLAGAAPLEIADAWDLGRGVELQPDVRIDAAAVRTTYARARG